MTFSRAGHFALGTAAAMLITARAFSAAPTVSPPITGSPASPELCRANIACASQLWREETFELKPKAGTAPYVIHLSIPGTPPPPAGYPVVYLLDAGTAFGTLADIALYVLFTQPRHFDTYVAGDPTIGIRGYQLVQRVPALQKQGIAGSPRRVLLTRGVGGDAPEVLRFAKRAGIPLPKERPPDPNAVSLAEFAKMLESINGLSVSYVEFPGETHETMVPAHLGRGMRWTLTGWDPP